ncbi:hypothetical protein O6H91_19G032400 [Diphasiastrum complanatum]|uniref:Uncharacterized protein n=1 Tax=Diphasiastrum complanatum TaxID=34168 RepID=A0ACC2ATU3_DIPCM|nr:hypothetical protein O6H91_19G032400 [Diphasiastrum complanatum]
MAACADHSAAAIEPSTFLRVPCSELTLAIIKPEAVDAGYVHDITYAMHSNGFVTVAETQARLTRVRAEEFYEEYSSKPYYQQLTCFICSGPIHVFVLGKEKAIESWQILMGPTNPDIACNVSPSSASGSFA